MIKKIAGIVIALAISGTVTSVVYADCIGGGTGGGSASWSQYGCPAGYGGYNCTKNCPPGYTWSDDKCVANCPSGDTWTNDECTSNCSSGYSWEDDKCVVSCKSGYTWESSRPRYWAWGDYTTSDGYCERDD